MSKYIKAVPLTRIDKLLVVQGNGRTMKQVKGAEGCDLICNGGFYSAAGKPTHHLKTEGVVLAEESWGCWGYAWDRGEDIHLAALPEAGAENYIGAYELLTPMVGRGAALSYGAELAGRRGRTALGLAGGQLVLWCAGDGTGDACTPEGLKGELEALGCESALMLDGGGSSQCSFEEGETITSSRRVNNYVCVWLKPAEGAETASPAGGTDTSPLVGGETAGRGEGTMSKKVCLDPGHGVETAGKRSPDGSYLEHEFTLDMAGRMKAILEGHGVEVTLTREDEHDVTLAQRVRTANSISGLDLFVSLHSNAAGDGSDWKSARGYEVYTSAPGVTAPRNVAAREILARVKEAGVTVRSEDPKHEGWYVCVYTTAPAVLIEHLFHDNREDVELLKSGAYRQTLALANCRGILDYLGIPWAEEQEEAPWYAQARAWVMERGISDGERPEEACTRAEVWEMLRRFWESLEKT